MNWELERLFGCMDRGREQKLPPAQLTLREMTEGRAW